MGAARKESQRKEDTRDREVKEERKEKKSRSSNVFDDSTLYK